MSDVLYRYSNMLKDFIVDELSGPSNRNVDKHRYNNLKLFMDLERFVVPHICVRIGISEGVISLESGDLIYGSLGHDPKIIKKWLRRNAVYPELLQIWNTLNIQKQKEEQDLIDKLNKQEKVETKEEQDFDDFFE